jgi:transposase
MVILRATISLNIKNINRACNDLKFYIFKERLLYKASTKNKYVICVNEAYTTQTCSYCDKINKPKASKIYYCSNYNIHMGRDVNAAKNILMKGIISNL